MAARRANSLSSLLSTTRLVDGDRELEFVTIHIKIAEIIPQVRSLRRPDRCSFVSLEGKIRIPYFS